MRREAEAKQPILELSKVQERVSRATGVSISSIKKIAQEMKAIEDGESGTFSTPNKKRKRSAVKTNLDQMDKEIIRRYVTNYHVTVKERKVPTLRRILQKCKDDNGYTGSKENLRRIFINNEFVKSKGGNTFEVINPSDGSVITNVEYGTKEDVDLAIKAARAAFEFDAPWRTMDAAERGKLLYKLADLIEEEADYIASLESLDNGKPYLASRNGDLPSSLSFLRYYAGWADKIHGKVIPMNGQFFTYTRAEPVGVCGQIIPWNFPLKMFAWKIAPALAAGNTIVIKPAEQTPLTALYAAHLIKKAGFPPGVVNVVPGDGETGAAVVAHPEVDKVAFTGSTEVGLMIQQECAKNKLKRLTLELGGKSPLIVLDGNIDKAVEIAQVGAIYNAGQACCALTRTYVHSSIYDEFVKKSVERAKKIKVGDPFDPKTQQGPQVDQTQFDKILKYIDIGVKEGARLVVGGKRFGDSGFFIEPTVFADVKDKQTIAKEEIFGPVQSIFKFENLDDAIKRANDTTYGLAAAIFSKDVDKINYIVPRLKAGNVWVNTGVSNSAQTPFGGYKNSGMGREGGEYGLHQYLEIKTVVTTLNGNKIS